MQHSGTPIAVVGLGYVGLPLAVEFGRIRNVIGFDINESRIKELKKGVDKTLETTNDELKDAIYLSFSNNLEDLKKLLETQIINQYSQSLNAITKKNILDQLETSHNISLPDGLINNELMSMTQNLNKEDKEKHLENNKKIASSRIKLGLILSACLKLVIASSNLKDFINA